MTDIGCADAHENMGKGFGIAASLLALPTPETADMWRSGAVLNRMNALRRRPEKCGEAHPHNDGVGANDSHTLLRELRIDYTRMFSHPEHRLIPPYESQFTLDGASGGAMLFSNPIAMDVQGAIKGAGFDIAGASNEPADYVVCELELLQVLHAACAHYARTAAREREDACLHMLSDFTAKHASRWLENFFCEVESHANTAFFQSVGAFGKDLMKAHIYLLERRGALTKPEGYGTLEQNHSSKDEKTASMDYHRAAQMEG